MSEMAAAHHHHQQQQQMLQAQLDSAAASMMVANGGGGGGGTLVRPPIGGVPIFPPGAVSTVRLISFVCFVERVFGSCFRLCVLLFGCVCFFV